MTNCKSCAKKKVNFKLYVPAGCELGNVDVYGVDENDKVISRYIPGRVRGDWNSDDESDDESQDDPDYVPSDESDVELVYENSHLSRADIEELESELADIIRDQIEEDNKD